VPGRPPLRGLISAYGSTLFLTLTNPLTILSFAAIFAGLGVASASGAYSAAGLLVLGVFLGSGLWWLFLSSVVGVFRARMGPRQLRWVNWLSGGIIVVFGVLALLSARG
jgi:threonine/homoserine/homoserine lactone efflux protein